MGGLSSSRQPGWPPPAYHLSLITYDLKIAHPTPPCQERAQKKLTPSPAPCYAKEAERARRTFVQGGPWMATTLYFTRHGETFWNVENKICGATDIGLTPRGR